MTTAFDSHAHAWHRWPYDDYPANPASGEALLAAMNEHGVARALIICAGIDHNPENNAYVADIVRRNRDFLAYMIDADCIWSSDHHTSGALSRLQRLIEEFPDAAGVTHYVDVNVDDWFTCPEGRAWLDCVTSSYGVLSLSAGPAWAPIVHEIAKEHADLTILWHHLAGVRVTDLRSSSLVAATAEEPNIVLKLSGLHYISEHATRAPWADTWPLLNELYAMFGAGRMCWGSDFPASLRYTDYATARAAIRVWMDRLEEPHRAALSGGNLARVLKKGTLP
jgi:predicted TIM-barrel fold metal-dependent hydrolase